MYLVLIPITDAGQLKHLSLDLILDVLLSRARRSSKRLRR
jgi:hypothetical protein